MTEKLIEVKGLQKYFPVGKDILGKPNSFVKAVDGVNFAIYKGETLGLVGESGCGKSTAGRTLLKLYEPTGGQILYKGKDISNYSKSKMKPLRKEMQIIFQDPYSSLNPRMSVSQIVSEGIKAHKLLSDKTEIKNRVDEVVEMCGLAKYHTSRYPHQFSGGQRQRIGIARALAVNPSFVVADEPVSALDVSIQSQIINLMQELQVELGLSYLFISHDLSVVKHISDRVGVMYLGSLVELAPKKTIFDSPLHPYTRALMSAIPEPDPTIKPDKLILTGDIPSNVNLPSGCKFHTRCPFAKDICKQEIPEFKDYGDEHYVACHFTGQV
jgi:oligopeptide/dipeptide ABC transporter ATP-binding protein